MIEIQTIIRTAAMMYADDNQVKSKDSVCRTFIDAAFVSRDNAMMTMEEILSVLEKDFEIIYQERDINPILNKGDFFVIEQGKRKEEDKYYLPKKRFDKLHEKTKNNIDVVIDKYISTQSGDTDHEHLHELLNRYLYLLLNTNIDAYRQLLENKSSEKPIKVDATEFESDEIDEINNFLKWQNDDKDAALFQLINYCIEYAITVNKISENDVVAALKNKQIYLDNALIYRALGINGEYRKNRIIDLIKLCKDSGQKILISSVSREEFFETIEYHINTLKKSAPFGRINPAVFKRYSDGGSFYQYYHEWRHNKGTYGFTTFALHVRNEYKSLLMTYGIEEDFKAPIKPDNDIDNNTIDQYKEGIATNKYKHNNKLNVNDATNMLWIERKRGGNNHSVRDTKYYFMTSDQKLQTWDHQHSENQPITMLPSQWMALLLKFVSRTKNDFKSFVSFLNLSKEKPLTTPEELQDIMAGISEITEELKDQEDIVSDLLERNSTSHLRTREGAKRFAKEKVEEKYREQLEKQAAENEKRLNAAERDHAGTINLLKEEHEKFMDQMVKEHQKEILQNKVDAKNALLSNLKKQKKDAVRKKEMIERLSEDKKNSLKQIYIFGIAIIFVVWCAVIFHFGWETMEMWTYIVGLAFAVVTCIINISLGGTWKPQEFLENYKKNQFDKFCLFYNFNVNEIEDIQVSISNVEKELAELKIEQSKS